MIRRCSQVYEAYEDRLVKRWFCRCHGQRAQGKRISKKLSYEILATPGGRDFLEVYAKEGRIQGIKALYYAMGENRKLLDAKKKMESWLGYTRVTKYGRFE